jgi:hypothetical protein
MQGRFHDFSLSNHPCTVSTDAHAYNYGPTPGGYFQTNDDIPERAELREPAHVDGDLNGAMEASMSFGKGALLWLIGIPLPIILLLAIFLHH